MMPRDGEVLCDRVWVYDAREDSVLVTREGRSYYPQCNTDQRIVEMLIGRNYPGMGHTMLPVAFMGRNDYYNGYTMDWLKDGS